MLHSQLPYIRYSYSYLTTLSKPLDQLEFLFLLENSVASIEINIESVARSIQALFLYLSLSLTHFLKKNLLHGDRPAFFYLIFVGVVQLLLLSVN